MVLAKKGKINWRDSYVVLSKRHGVSIAFLARLASQLGVNKRRRQRRSQEAADSRARCLALAKKGGIDWLDTLANLQKRHGFPATVLNDVAAQLGISKRGEIKDARREHWEAQDWSLSAPELAKINNCSRAYVQYWAKLTGNTAAERKRAFWKKFYAEPGHRKLTISEVAELTGHDTGAVLYQAKLCGHRFPGSVLRTIGKRSEPQRQRRDGITAQPKAKRRAGNQIKTENQA